MAKKKNACKNSFYICTPCPGLHINSIVVSKCHSHHWQCTVTGSSLADDVVLSPPSTSLPTDYRRLSGHEAWVDTHFSAQRLYCMNGCTRREGSFGLFGVHAESFHMVAVLYLIIRLAAWYWCCVWIRLCVASLTSKLFACVLKQCEMSWSRCHADRLSYDVVLCSRGQGGGKTWFRFSFFDHQNFLKISYKTCLLPPNLQHTHTLFYSIFPQI